MQTATTHQAHRSPWHANVNWRLVAYEILGTSAILVVYFFLRGIRPEDVESSVARSLALIRFEQQARIFWEVRIQELFIDRALAITAANWIYAWAHYVILISIALWLVVTNPVRFRFVRNVMLVSAVIGVVTYWLFPAAPPRLMELHGFDFGFVDTVHGEGSNAYYLQPGPFVNDYAALPSFHFGWMALASAAIWVNTTNWRVRAGAVSLSVVMTWAIVVTGNHYFFDMIFGGVVIAFAWMVVSAMPQGSFVEALRRAIPARRGAMVSQS
jgi:hypothetical protein